MVHVRTRTMVVLLMLWQALAHNAPVKSWFIWPSGQEKSWASKQASARREPTRPALLTPKLCIVLAPSRKKTDHPCSFEVRVCQLITLVSAWAYAPSGQTPMCHVPCSGEWTTDVMRVRPVWPSTAAGVLSCICRRKPSNWLIKHSLGIS
jgi:hypothetical protein